MQVLKRTLTSPTSSGEFLPWSLQVGGHGCQASLTSPHFRLKMICDLLKVVDFYEIKKFKVDQVKGHFFIISSPDNLTAKQSIISV